MRLKPPELVAHADWGAAARKRWMARAVRDAAGCYRAERAERVRDATALLDDLRRALPQGGTIMLGFDFPIGLPCAYARAAGISNFRDWLPQVGHGPWKRFFDVAQRQSEISHWRPFYPHRPGGTRQAHLLRALGEDSMHALRRRCELARPGRRAACPLFWTLGGQQVGKAALAGWREIFVPALRSETASLLIWPFDGTLDELLRSDQTVVTETYPAEFYDHLGVDFPRPRPGSRSGKRVQLDRVSNAQSLLDWAADAGVRISGELRAEVLDGFGDKADGEDRFDAVVGLFGMLNVVLGHRPPGEPDDEVVRSVEGWILGRTPQ